MEKRIFSETHLKKLREAQERRNNEKKLYEEENGRVCTYCKQTKKRTDFYIRDKITGSVASVCKDCMKIRHKKWVDTPKGRELTRKRNKKHYSTEKRRIASRLYKNKLDLEWYAELIKLGFDKCSVCGYDKNISALDLHHVDPELKEFNVSKWYSRPFKEEYLKELEKCICLCSNCHREIHAPHRNHTMKDLLEDKLLIMETLLNPTKLK